MGCFTCPFFFIFREWETGWGEASQQPVSLLGPFFLLFSFLLPVLFWELGASTTNLLLPTAIFLLSINRRGGERERNILADQLHCSQSIVPGSDEQSLEPGSLWNLLCMVSRALTWSITIQPHYSWTVYHVGALMCWLVLCIWVLVLTKYVNQGRERERRGEERWGERREEGREERHSSLIHHLS